MASPFHSDHSTCSIVVPLLVLASPVIQTISVVYWMECKGQVSHIVPPQWHVPLLSLLSPFLSLQAPSICFPHHIPHLYLPHGRSCTPWMTSPFRLYPCLSLPLFRFFSILEVLGKRSIHLYMNSHVYTTPSCLNVHYLTAFSCSWKHTIFYCEYILARYLEALKMRHKYLKHY